MGTAERRLEILKYLCQKRHATMSELAKEFGVSIRTIHRDIFEIEETIRAPIETKRGKCDGGVYLMEGYTIERAYMTVEELSLLLKVQSLVSKRLSIKENEMLAKIIKNYTKGS